MARLRMRRATASASRSASSATLDAGSDLDGLTVSVISITTLVYPGPLPSRTLTKAFRVVPARRQNRVSCDDVGTLASETTWPRSGLRHCQGSPEGDYEIGAASVADVVGHGLSGRIVRCLVVRALPDGRHVFGCRYIRRMAAGASTKPREAPWDLAPGLPR